MRPQTGEFAAFYAPYIAKVKEGDILDILEEQHEAFVSFAESLHESQTLYRYEEGKWSIKEVIAHIADAEQIFAYRALRIMRGDTTPLPAFDENAYVSAGNFDSWDWEDLVARCEAVRGNTLMTFLYANEEELARMGTMSGNPTSVRAILYIIAGHQLHHLEVIKQRYLSKKK